MNLPATSTGKARPVVISSLSAKIPGRARVGSGLSTQRLTNTFPSFNSNELISAINELPEKQLCTQKGVESRGMYPRTDFGRNGRVAIA